MSATTELLEQIAEMETRIEELKSERDELAEEAKTDKRTIERLTEDYLALQHRMARFETDRVAKAFHEYMRRSGLLSSERDVPWAAAPTPWRTELMSVAMEGGAWE